MLKSLLLLDFQEVSSYYKGGRNNIVITYLFRWHHLLPLNIFNQIIKLPELKVKNYQFIEGFGVVLTVENIEKKARCPRCGKKSERLHQNHEYERERFTSSRTPGLFKSKSQTIKMRSL